MHYVLFKYSLCILFYRERLLLDSEPEDLHQFRINIRKSRAFLKEFKSLLPKKHFHYIYDHLSLFASETNKKRDLDVIKEHFMDDNLILEIITKQQLSEEEKIEKMLRSHSFNLFFITYHDLLKTDKVFDTVQDPENISNTAKEILTKLHIKILDKIDQLEKNYQDAELHKVRIALKKLRYLLEEFQGVLDSNKVEKFIKKGKKLQTLLGDFNDLVSQTALLHEFFDLYLKTLPQSKEIKERYLKETSQQEEQLRTTAMKKLHKFKKKALKL